MVHVAREEHLGGREPFLVEERLQGVHVFPPSRQLAHEHEGFGVPLVESMLMRVPVVAYRCTAVGDTLGEAGVQFAEKRVAEMAEAAHLLTTDAAVRAAVLAGQDRRLAAFAPAAVEGALRGYLDSLGVGSS